MSTKKMLKILAYVVLAFAVFIVGLNSYTITPAGQTKVQTCFGKVQPDPLLEGFHFPVNPACSFDTYDTREFKYEINDIEVPTQDRFNSSANVTALIRVNPTSTPSIKKNYGDMSQFLDKTIRQQLRAMVRDEGRKLKDSRSLAISEKVTGMQINLNQRLTKTLQGRISVSDVLVQDIKFDPRISAQILKTQERIQKEEAENSLLRIKETQARQLVAQKQGAADSQRLQADANAYEVETAAKAQQFKLKSNADAERYTLEQQAEGNLKLTRSLTPSILKMKELEVRQAEAGKGWNGELPATFSPIYSDGKSGQTAPFILRTVK